jgi:hypothetical protein
VSSWWSTQKEIPKATAIEHLLVSSHFQWDIRQIFMCYNFNTGFI